MRFNSKIIQHYENLQHVGSLNEDDSKVGSALVGHAANGNVIQFFIQCNDEAVIEAIKFKAQASVVVVAACSWLADYLQNKTLEEAHNIDSNFIHNALGLPSTKVHCSLLVVEALKAAIADYKKKRGELCIA